MKAELKASYPALDIELLGVNYLGHESGNELATEGRNIPMLQDVDAGGDGESDAWTLWGVEYRDVVILDGANEKVGVYNLTTYNLAEEANYANLREMLADAAMQNQKPWMNPADGLDIDDSSYVSPLDALIIINELNSAGSHQLAPPTTSELSPPYYDCNGDGDVTPSDVLQVINFLNNESGAGEGEGESTPLPGESGIEVWQPTGILQSAAVPNELSGDLLSENRDLLTQQPSVGGQDSGESQAIGVARVDEVSAAPGDRPSDRSRTTGTWTDPDLEDQLEWYGGWLQITDDLQLTDCVSTSDFLV